MLRGRKPEPTTKRLKMLLYGPAGCGKTTSAIQFPRPYIIDCERGTDNYDKLINASGGAVFQSTSHEEIIAEIKSLASEKHDYRTLVIDPMTAMYNDLLEKMEKKVGEAHGRHFGAANKVMKRLSNLIMSLDMNVVVTSHAKTEYGQNMQKLGNVFDCWKSSDYIFDLVMELFKNGPKRFGRVQKTRIESFPDGEQFEWNYEAIRQRYGAELLEKEAVVIAFANPAQIREIKDLLSVVKLPEGMVEKWFEKAQVEDWADMPADLIVKCIEYTKNRLPSSNAAA